MTPHLSSQEFVDALDGALDPIRRPHLDSCERCQRELGDVQGLLTSVSAAPDPPEPSPLFWEHFSRRVQAAVTATSPSRPRWWQVSWRPMLAIGSVVAAVVLTVVVRENAGSSKESPASSVTTTGESAGGAADEDLMNFVADVASSMPYEDVQQAAAPTADATDAMVAQLTPKERAELVRLLKAQMRGDD
jgi:hypothetical protein